MYVIVYQVNCDIKTTVHWNNATRVEYFCDIEAKIQATELLRLVVVGQATLGLVQLNFALADAISPKYA